MPFLCGVYFEQRMFVQHAYRLPKSDPSELRIASPKHSKF